MTKIQKLILVIIVVLAAMFRFGELGDISTGIHADESSQAYNAYSLLKTGKDMYGKAFPILFRANGSYQPPVYTYLTIIPVALFGNTIFSAKFISAFSGTLLVLLSFILVFFYGVGDKRERTKQGLFVSLVLAISPWSVHFSRLAVEGNLVVAFFALGVFIAAISLKKKRMFPLACLIFALTTHVYYTERITSILFIVLFTFLFRSYFLKRKKEIVVGFVIFAIILIPHLFIARTGALTKRMSQVGYVGSPQAMSGNILERVSFLSGQFADHYISYFSPKNLFFDPGQSLGRTTSDLSVFYPWFFVFAIAGASYLLNNKKNLLVKLLVIIVIIAPIPAGITGDLFYPLRVLTFLWAVTLILGYGFYYAWEKINPRFIKYTIIAGIFIYSGFYFYISYFATAKYAQSPDLGYSYIKLVDELQKYKDKKVFIDFSGRSWGVGIRMAYLLKADPVKIQKSLSSQLATPYYSEEINAWETYTIDNITIKPLNWFDACGGAIVVGDRYSVSESQIKDHDMKLEFAVKNLVNEDTLFGYSAFEECVN